MNSLQLPDCPIYAPDPFTPPQGPKAGIYRAGGTCLGTVVRQSLGCTKSLVWGVLILSYFCSGYCGKGWASLGSEGVAEVFFSPREQVMVADGFQRFTNAFFRDLDDGCGHTQDQFCRSGFA